MGSDWEEEEEEEEKVRCEGPHSPRGWMKSIRARKSCKKNEKYNRIAALIFYGKTAEACYRLLRLEVVDCGRLRVRDP